MPPYSSHQQNRRSLNPKKSRRKKAHNPPPVPRSVTIDLAKPTRPLDETPLSENPSEEELCIRDIERLLGGKPAPVYVDADGFTYCDRHRLEHCDECRLSFALPNKMHRMDLKGKPVDVREMAAKEQAKRGHELMSLAAAAKTDVHIGDADAKALHQKVNKTCQHCGKSDGAKMLRCSRCKVTTYCGAECQRAAWKAHKTKCEELQRGTWSMRTAAGNVKVLAPDDPRWVKPTAEDVAQARALMQQGYKAEQVQAWNPMLGGWMLSLEIEEMCGPQDEEDAAP